MMRFVLAAVVLAMASGCVEVANNSAGTESAYSDDPAIRVARLQCEDHTRQHHRGLTFAGRRAAMENEIQDYLRLAEEALSMRAAAIQLHRELKGKTARGLPLSGQDLKLLNEGAAKLLEQRSNLLRIAQIHECWLDQADPRDEREAGIHAAGIAMSLSAALILYDNYLSAIAPFRQDHEFRQHLNRSDHGFNIHAGALNEIAISFASPENRRRTKRAIDWVERNAKTLKVEPFEQYGYLLRSIEQSPSLHMVRQFSMARDLGAGLGFFSTFTVDTLFALKNEGTNLSSLLFGNAIGLVEARRGKLYEQAPIANRVRQALKAGDILVEKTPFRLTDSFIPGHWGHAAIWVGGEPELRALGIWDHPVVQPHHDAVRAGRGVVEALRSGVRMSSIEHFLNVDDLAILRHPTLGKDALAEVVLQSFRQVGKSYDFNFDAETTHRVFCSKLVYLAYGDMKWPTSRVLGRVTVSPDNIAALATGNGPLRVALLYHNGEEVTDQPQTVMDRLMRAEITALARREGERQSVLALQDVD